MLRVGGDKVIARANLRATLKKRSQKLVYDAMMPHMTKLKHLASRAIISGNEKVRRSCRWSHQVLEVALEASRRCECGVL